MTRWMQWVVLVVTSLVADFPSLGASSDRGWTVRLQKALDGCDRIRVRTGGTCHRRPQMEKTLFEEKEPERIRHVVEALKIIEPRSGEIASVKECMCCGEPSIEFYKEGKLLLTLGIHHGQSVRWEGFSGDQDLTPEAVVLLEKWFAEHKLHFTEEEIEEGEIDGPEPSGGPK